MTIHENQKDREQQRLAAFQLQRHLYALGATTVTLSETPEHRRDCYDFVIEEAGKWTGVCEVKSRRVTSDQIEEWGSVLIEVERLKALREQFHHSSEVTGKKFWSKEIVFLWRCANDETCFAINMRAIVENWDDLGDAPSDMMKDNHGEEAADKSGKLIPVRLLEKFQ